MGKAAVGIVTAMVLTVTAGQILIVSVLLRRHIDFDVKAWSKPASSTRKGLAVLLVLFYASCYLWATRDTFTGGDLDASTLAGMATGAAFAIGLLFVVVAASKRVMRKHQAEDDAE